MSAQQHIQQSQLPPAQPAYILRGHKAQIHALQFLRGNSRLLSGDTEGIIILWDVAVKRAKAVWRGHAGGILGLGIWGDDKIISHGRDGKLNVWQLREVDEEGLSTELPVDEGSQGDGKIPWLLHSLQVHTLNFCAFAMCEMKGGNGIFIATPAVNEGATVIHALPLEEIKYLVPPAETGKTGMVMALRLALLDDALHVVTGYESGLTSVQRLKVGTKHTWETISVCKPHTQPILSLDILPGSGIYYTSSADAVIAMASLQTASERQPLKTNETKHSGQQGLTVRSDGKIFATAGWDGRMRVYSAKSLKEAAVLKWHKEGCYTVAFAHIGVAGASIQTSAGACDFGPSTENKIADRPGRRSVVSTFGSQRNTTVRQRREDQARETHWLAAGSKDGKVSLWDIF
jgi:WD40 repeat protein